MRVQNLPLLSYTADDMAAKLTFKADSIAEVKAVVGAEIVILNDVDMPIVQLDGYTIIDVISVAPQAGTITLRILRQNKQVLQHAESIKSLEQENKLLKAQLEASIQSNQMLEDCLVEMAGIVYA